MNRRQRVRSSLLLAAVVALVVLGSARTAAAQSGSEQIDSFDSTIVINKDGSADITEVITYDFGYNSRHGIDRLIPTVFPWEGDSPKGASPGASFDRVTPIEDIEVSTSAGTPDDVDT